jgi:hypothetical protein
LGYVPFDRITDQKNDPPVVRLWKPPQPKAYLSVDFPVTVPDADDLEPRVGVDGFRGTQPYHLALLGEKSSLETVLGPIAQRYQADLYLPSGDISNTLAKTSAADGRPLVVLYFSDCDPSGWNMPIAVARKLLAFKIQQFPELEFQCYRAALRPDQVRQHDLPISPVKENDKRGAAWESSMGVQQTEIDAIATLQPQLLRRIAEEAIAPFFDRSLAAKVERAKQQWLNEAQQSLSEQIGDVEWLRADVARQLAEMRDQIRELLDAVRVDPASVDLPTVPEIPVAEFDPDREQPMPLCDSRWSFAEQTRRLIASKNYANGEAG